MVVPHYDSNNNNNTYICMYALVFVNVTCSSLFVYIVQQFHGITGWDRHSGQWAPYSTHWYIPMGSRVVPRYSGMGQTLWTVGPIQYTLVQSYGVPCSPTVQRDGTDTLDSGPHTVHIGTVLWSPVQSHGTAGWDRPLDSEPHTVHIGTFLWGPVQSHGTAGWDRPLDSEPHTVHIGTFLWGPVQSHGTAGWDRHSGQWAPYSTHWYSPMESRVVPRYSGMGQTLWTVGPIQYTLVQSYGVPCSPTVQRDGTDTLDSGPHTVHIGTFLWGPV